MGTIAWTDTAFLIKKALEKGDIEAVEGEFDTYRIIK